ncbi:MAG: hypothetical protein LCH46_06385 [Proteobacteria bacterium]|nr:hypothetical protein [Pseudomonadota bacterium]
MATIQSFFPTLVYRAEFANAAKLNRDLEMAAQSLSRDDIAGLRWCEKHGYPGYTSYASLDDLSWRIPIFKKLERLIDKHALAFAKALHWDIRGGKPICDSMWVNVMPEGGSHTSHIHPNSVISGTYYVTVPEGAGPIVYEDPRLALMMAAPPRKGTTPRGMRGHVSETPRPGSLLLWESWLRHEVPLNKAEGERISVSFNYVIGSR